MRTLESILRAKTFQSMRLISSVRLNIIWSGRRELAYRQHLLALSTKSGFTPLVTQVWSGWADLNRRPLAPEASALPLSHTPISEFTTAHPASVLLFRCAEKIARPGGRPDDLRPDEQSESGGMVLARQGLTPRPLHYT